MSITYDPTDPRFPDLNKYHSFIDEAAFRAAKPVALGFRVHSDLSGEDPTFARHEAVAKDLGIVRLGYDYEADGTPDGFVDLFKPEAGRIPVLDAEYKSITMAEAVTWATTIYKAWGRLPVLYGHALLNTWHPATNSILRQMPSWQATYGMSLNPVPWAKEPFLWQYSDGATKWSSPGPRSFPGCGPCDMNTLRIPVDELRRMAGIVPPPPGGPVLTDDDAKQLGYATVHDWAIQEQRAKAVSDVLAGRASRGSPPEYVDQYDKTKAALAVTGGLAPHTHGLEGFPPGTGGVK